MEPTRLIYGYIQDNRYFFILLTVSLIVFTFGMARRIMFWSCGLPLKRNDQIFKRLKPLGKYVFLNKGNLRGTYPRLMHLSIFYGFIILAFGSGIIALKEHFGIDFYQGYFYLVLSLLLDVAGGGAILGIGLLAYRRYVERPGRLENRPADAALIILLLAMLITGFLVEGMRINMEQDPWGIWSPVGFGVSWLIDALGFKEAQVRGVYEFSWYIHSVIILIGFACLPYSKLMHMFTGFLNYLFRPLNTAPLAATVEIRGGNTTGMPFTWKQLMEVDTCIQCGRCKKNCSVYLEHEEWSPQKFNRWLKVAGKQWPTDNKGDLFNRQDWSQIIEGVWACTDCRVCEDRCPMLIEHVAKFIQIRGWLTESGISPSLNLVRRRIDVGSSEQDLAHSASPTEIIYWAGCQGRNPQSKAIFEAMLKIFHAAGIKFSVIGTSQQCCGHIQRYQGRPAEFRKIAQDNIANLQNLGSKPIVTNCPHCLTTLKDDYREFGVNFEVFHHTQFLQKLLNSGRLKLRDRQLQDVKDLSVTFHDPCFLGRYQGIYEEPRQVLAAIPGLQLIEMKKARHKAMCCGAGEERLHNALKTKAELLVTACPFCSEVLNGCLAETSSKQKMRILDVAEIVAEHLPF